MVTASAGHTDSIRHAPMIPFVVGVMTTTTTVTAMATRAAPRRTTAAVVGNQLLAVAAPLNSSMARHTRNTTSGMSYGVGLPEPSMAVWWIA